MSGANLRFEIAAALKGERAARGSRGGAMHLGAHPMVIYVERLAGTLYTAMVAMVALYEQATNVVKMTATRDAVRQKTVTHARESH